jgi:hypothetical protein
MPRAAKAAIRCSIVDRRTPSAFSIMVFRRASMTASPDTGIRLSRSVMSVRTKTMPTPGAAGRIARRTRSPV